MATIATNVLTRGMSGKLGDALVFKVMRGKTFATLPARKPNKKKESAAQRNTRSNFREATEWAQGILLDPEKKAYYKQRAKALKLPNAYTAAITDYMRKFRVVKMQDRKTVTYRINKRGFTVQDVKVEPIETTGVQPKVIIRQKNDTWLVRYTLDAAQPSLALVITDNQERQWNYDVGILSKS